jgi:hypothetical protein
MALQLAEMATQGAPGKYAVFLLDQAGWHLAKALKGPPDITIPPLPPKSPKLNPVDPSTNSG